MPIPTTSTGLAITNPLVLYRALLATKRIDPDPSQHRLAIHLQKLYERLKDYEPVVEYSHRLRQISRTLAHPTKDLTQEDVAQQRPKRGKWLGSLFEPRKEKEALALTRVLTSQEAAMQLDSPKGLMLHGEVGTGKSMLIDLFADCLPNRKKKRWHFTTFMLDTMAQLEQLRRSRQMVIPASLGQQDDYSLLWLARNMISTSPILFLDEFQLPDRAASKILTNLLTSFFHLGGVLIATSNRMPEELAKAAGMEFPPPPSRLDSLKWSFGISGGRPQSGGGLFSGEGDFGKFLEVLKARCEVWEMDSRKDYRRRESESEGSSESENQAVEDMSSVSFDGFEPMAAGNVGLGYEQSRPLNESIQESQSASFPRNFLVKPKSSALDEELQQWSKTHEEALAQALQHENTIDSISSWTPATLKVYGRTVIVPRQHSGVSAWTFPELCASTLGPADYISLASTYHTLVLTDVPVLSILHKNEARRFITLLDALYEAKCKLFITAEAGPDNLFFPEVRRSDSTATASAGATSTSETVDHDAIHAETFAEAYQDATAPFRPNISMYSSSASSSPEPDYTHSRLAGVFSSDQLEDQPPNKPSTHRHSDNGYSDSIYGRDSSIHGPSLDERDIVSAGGGRGGLDFSKSGVFTGEDEQFAYKRARSRLWEMCGARWWARGGEVVEWWRPLDRAVRHWEGPIPVLAVAEVGTASINVVQDAIVAAREGTSSSHEVTEQLDEVMFRHGASPFRNSREPPPKISDVHVWGVVKWGRKAGAWGKGVEGLAEKGSEVVQDGQTEKRERRREEGRREAVGGDKDGNLDEGKELGAGQSGRGRAGKRQ